jgi:hypothetical protein
MTVPSQVKAGVAKNYSFLADGNTLSAPTHTVDVVSLLNIPVDPMQPGWTPATITQTTDSGFTLQQIAEHFATHPCVMVNLNIPNSVNAAVIATAKFWQVRREPDGTFTARDQNLAMLLTANDFQPNRVQMKGDGVTVYDGETYFRLTWTAQNPLVASFLFSLSMGPALNLAGMAQNAEGVYVGGVS